MDWKRWNADRLAAEAEIRDLKTKRREPCRPRWTGGPDDWRLAKLKKATSLLYAVRAHARGKLHAPAWEEAHADAIRDTIAKYRVPPESAAA
jgi:hypothetical protein